jgi:hypothetical protein
LDLSEVATNRITREEFEFSWASGLVRERDFGEFKWELLASGMEDIQGVYEAWWYANTWYPNRPLSERLNMAERALRELLAEGLIILIGSRDDPEESEIPRARHDHVLRAWDTWTLGSPGIKASYRISDAG